MTKKTAQPLYLQVKSSVKSRIRTGLFLPGCRLPSETDLAAEFDCSRLTVHRAIRELADEGIVERRRRAGTRVAQPDGAGLLVRIRRIGDEISQRGFAYTYEFISSAITLPPAGIRHALGGAADEKMLHLRCRYRAGKRVFQFEDRWINLATVPTARHQSFEHQGPGTWLLDHVPLSEVRHEISAVSARGTVAKFLEVPENTPLLQLHRNTSLDQKPVTSALLLHPGDLYTLRPESRLS